MHVRCVAETFQRFSFFGECGLLVETVALAVQIVDTLGNHLALGIEPRTLSDEFTCVEYRRRVVARPRAQICVPGFRAARGFRECLAHVIGPGYTAEISSFAGTLARNKETHHRRCRAGRLPPLRAREQDC